MDIILIIIHPRRADSGGAGVVFLVIFLLLSVLVGTHLTPLVFGNTVTLPDVLFHDGFQGWFVLAVFLLASVLANIRTKKKGFRPGYMYAVTAFASMAAYLLLFAQDYFFGSGVVGFRMGAEAYDYTIWDWLLTAIGLPLCALIHNFSLGLIVNAVVAIPFGIAPGRKSNWGFVGQLLCWTGSLVLFYLISRVIMTVVSYPPVTEYQDYLFKESMDWFRGFKALDVYFSVIDDAFRTAATTLQNIHWAYRLVGCIALIAAGLFIEDKALESVY